MRRQEATAKRYAKALFLVARESGRLEAVGDELSGFVEVMAADRRLDEVLTRPWLKGSTKKSVAIAVADRLGCGKLVKDFLGLLALRGRMDHVGQVAQAYQGLLDVERGRVRARVRSAVALSDHERGKLRAGLARVAAKEVIVEESVDSTLLGGFVAQIGSLVLDGSLNGQLARMRERLVRG
jgi:F-type H+-transporting ATPase subunit delta